MAFESPDFAGNVEDQWQFQHSTLASAFSDLFGNESFADVRFVPMKNAPTPPNKFPAHKLVLRIRSPVFNKQFFYDETKAVDNKNMGQETSSTKEDHRLLASEKGPTAAKIQPKSDGSFSANNIQEIVLPDEEPEAFQQFLRFLYTDEGTITGENVFSLLYTANKYCVPFVARRCTAFVLDNIAEENWLEVLEISARFGYEEIREGCIFKVFSLMTPENAFYWLDLAHRNAKTEIEDAALVMLRQCARAAIGSESFLAASARSILRFASQTCLTVDEETLFNALINWAIIQRIKVQQNQEKSLRELLGPTLFCVHFWHMTEEQLSGLNYKNALLLDREIAFVLSAIKSGGVFNRELCPLRYVIKGEREKFKSNGRITIKISSFSSFGTRAETTTLNSDQVIVAGLPFHLQVYSSKKTAGQNRASPPQLSINLICIYMDICGGDRYFFPNWSVHSTCRVKSIRRGALFKELDVGYSALKSSPFSQTDDDLRLSLRPQNRLIFLAKDVPIDSLRNL